MAEVDLREVVDESVGLSMNDVLGVRQRHRVTVDLSLTFACSSANHFL